MIRLGDEELERAVEKLRTLGAELGKAESSYERLVAKQKQLKARKFLETKGTAGLTVRDREAMSEDDNEVTIFTDMIAEQKERYITLRYEIASVTESCNLFRTRSANIRGEKKLYGELG
jgi:hypothetical protein